MPCTKHWIRFNRGQINQGENYLKGITGRELIFWPKINWKRILFSLCNIRFGLSLTAHRETEAKLHLNFHYRPPRLSSPPKQMRPRQESAEEIHTAWIRNTSTPAAMLLQKLHFTPVWKKGASGYKIQKLGERKNLMTWLQNDSQIYFMVNIKNIK